MTMANNDLNIGRLSIWAAELQNPDFAIGNVVRQVEAAGFRAVWIPGGFDPSIFDCAGRIQDAADALQVGTSVVSVTAVDAQTALAGLDRLAGDRFILGLGVSHPEFIPDFASPLDTMANYLDAVSEQSDVRIMVGTLGPRMMGLAKEHRSGVQPYLVTPEHTRSARAILGSDGVLAPVQAVIFEADPREARERARAAFAIYLQLKNYVRNFRRMGFGDEDLADGGSDRFIDAIVAWGSDDAIARRIQEHFAAGADHVAVHVVAAAEQLPETWARLAALQLH
jgi:probable F420-dependent oxidoreductase